MSWIIEISFSGDTTAALGGFWRGHLEGGCVLRTMDSLLTFLTLMCDSLLGLWNGELCVSGPCMDDCNILECVSDGSLICGCLSLFVCKLCYLVG